MTLIINAKDDSGELFFCSQKALHRRYRWNYLSKNTFLNTPIRRGQWLKKELRGHPPIYKVPVNIIQDAIDIHCKTGEEIQIWSPMARWNLRKGRFDTLITLWKRGYSWHKLRIAWKLTKRNSWGINPKENHA